jgi:hypothetical protein
VCLLVMIGVRADGTKELVALADGFRESTESWAGLLRSCRRRGMTAPVLAVGDGALGFWKAVREVFSDPREQRCWFHVSSNVLAALPKSAHPGAKAALAEIYNAEDRDHALKAVKAFEADYGAKWAKAVAEITEHVDVLLARLSIGSTCVPRTRSSRPSPPSGCVSGSPRDPARGPPGSRWRSSSSSPHKPAGAPSTPPTSWPWSARAPGSRKGNSSNDPTNQEVTSKSRDTPIHSLDYSSAVTHPLPKRSRTLAGSHASRAPAVLVPWRSHHLDMHLWRHGLCAPVGPRGHVLAVAAAVR